MEKTKNNENVLHLIKMKRFILNKLFTNMNRVKWLNLWLKLACCCDGGGGGGGAWHAIYRFHQSILELFRDIQASLKIAKRKMFNMHIYRNY